MTKKVQGVKFQGVVAPDGIMVCFSDPYRDATHDSTILSISGFYKVLEEIKFWRSNIQHLR